MASIYKRKNANGTSVWRAVVRIDGYPTVCSHWNRKQEAEDWARETEHKIKLGQYKFDQRKKLRTFNELLDHYIANGAIEHHRSVKDTLRHLDYWKTRFGAFALIHITPELIAKERILFSTTPSASGRKRTSSTVNRYTASLSALFSYAIRQLRWIDESPCAHLQKLKENPGRDRILSEQEIESLLPICRQSRSPYLYCIVLISLTTGARQGEILNLEWSDVDFENCLAFLRETKNGRPRSIPLVGPVIDELKRLHQLRHSLKLLVFASKTAFGRIDIKKAWQTALRKAGIVNCRAHDMRHTFATLAAAQGASNLELGTAMGHRTQHMLQRYTHLDVQVTKRFSKNISEKILPIQPGGQLSQHETTITTT